MKIGERLKKIRKEKNLTQEEIAKLTNISPSTISKIENGIIYPSVEQLNIICKAYNNDINSIVEGNERTIENFAKSIATGVFSILIGISLFLSFLILFNETISFITLILSLIIGIIFFNKKGQIINAKKEDFKKYSKLLITSLILIIIDVIIYLSLMDTFVIIPLLSICIVIAALPISILTYVLVVSDSKQLQDDNQLTNKICGGVMLVITVVYFILGFKYKLWHPYWLLFILGGVICSIINKVIK